MGEDIASLIETIQKWGAERGFTVFRRQLKKVCEEALETQEAYTFYNAVCDSVRPRESDYFAHAIEEVGDIGIAWLLLCQSLDIDPFEALLLAHEKNKAKEKNND